MPMPIYVDDDRAMPRLRVNLITGEEVPEEPHDKLTAFFSSFSSKR
jgi:hypothetical protein